MKPLSLLITAFVLSACTTTRSAQPKVPGVQPKVTSAQPEAPGATGYPSESTRISEENLMLKKAVVKLIRKYREVDKISALQEEKLQRLEKKTALQEEKLRKLEGKSARHDRQISDIHSGMYIIKDFILDEEEKAFSVEVDMPVIEDGVQGRILKPAPATKPVPSPVPKPKSAAAK